MSCTKLLEPGSPFNLFMEKKGKGNKKNIDLSTDTGSDSDGELLPVL